jgi:hypothetical protein
VSSEALDTFLSDLAAASFGRAFPLFRRAPLTEHEIPDAACIRLSNLRHYLEERRGARIVAIGEAAGYRGMRWSGIAFTSERHLLAWGRPYELTYDDPERPKGWAEPSATIVHRELEALDAEREVILWNVVPAHPHKEGAPLSNRPPRVEEIARGCVFAEKLIKIINPEKVVAIAVGRVAERDLGYPYVRHPANGGATKFRQGIREHLR